jgi:hypothetical protein
MKGPKNGHGCGNGHAGIDTDMDKDFKIKIIKHTAKNK